MKANLKNKGDDLNEDDGNSDWESVEDDAPVVQLEELLANMEIKGGKSDDEYDSEDEDEDND